MEPPTGVWAYVWSFKFLPFFCGLLLLGIIKVGIVGSVLAGLAYGFLALEMATFDAVGEGKERPLIHCFVDGTWNTTTGSCTVVRDLKDMLFHSYFSILGDFWFHSPPDGKPYEIRMLDIPGAVFATACGLLVDGIMFTLIAFYKFPVMLFKGWKPLIEDLVGREGPFLETDCVPFAGLAILLWPFAVLGAFLASIISSVPLGAYATVVVYQVSTEIIDWEQKVFTSSIILYQAFSRFNLLAVKPLKLTLAVLLIYQESSLFMGLSYVISLASIFDEYTNDVLDMAPGSWFLRLKHRKNESSSQSGLLSRPASFKDKNDGKNAPSCVTSFKSSFDEFQYI